MKKNLSSFFSLTVNGAKKLLKKTQLLFVIGTLFTASCSSELELTQDAMTIETTSSIKTVSAKDAINLLKNQTPTTKSMFKNVESTSSLNFVYQEKITNSDQMLTIIPNNENKNSKYVFLNIKGKIETSIITTFPENTNTDSEFTGKIIIQRLDGSFVNGFRLKNGIIISRLEKKPTSKLTSNNTDPDPIELLEVIIPPKQKQYFSVVFIYYPYGDRANRGDLPESLMWDPTGGGGYIGDEPATEESIAQAIEDQIEDSQLDPCTKGVLDKLKNLSGGDITNMLKRFTPPGSIFNINMITGKVNSNANWAETTPLNGSRTDINMVFNENYINGTNFSSRPTDLSVATTMAHEVIHAYLISLLEENKACGASGICDFPTIYDAYVQRQISNNPNPNLTVDEHHELIAKNYVYAIASTIQEFHTGQYTVYPYQNYLDMAWGGLVGTTIFNKDFPNDPNDKNYKYRERILDRINTEKKGEQYQGYFPMGTPCKK